MLFQIYGRTTEANLSDAADDFWFLGLVVIFSGQNYTSFKQNPDSGAAECKSSINRTKNEEISVDHHVPSTG